jgi:hypothetical protein
MSQWQDPSINTKLNPRSDNASLSYLSISIYESNLNLSVAIRATIHSLLKHSRVKSSADFINVKEFEPSFYWYTFIIWLILSSLKNILIDTKSSAWLNYNFCISPVFSFGFTIENKLFYFSWNLFFRSWSGR